MHVIQLLLFAGLLLISFYVYEKFKNSLIDLFIIFVFLLTGMVFVAFPSITNKVAHAIGVGRGADMIFYLFIILFIFVILKMYARIRRIEQKLNAMVSENAIASAVEPVE